MKIKMLTLSAGPAGIRQPGKVYDLSPEEAARLIEAGYAEKVEAKAAAAPRTASRKGGRTGDKPDAGADPATASDADPQESQA